MSSLLEKDAASQASPLFNARRQLFHSVPPIPEGVRLDGKTVLVTGANVGLGLAASRHFLELGAARLVMAVRTVAKGEVEAAKLRADFPKVQIDVWALDLEKPESSVRPFAERCVGELGRLHVAVLNAGLGKHVFERMAEGHKRETTLQVNYLSTALLALLLLPVLKAPPGGEAGRLTLVTSDSALGVGLPAAAASSSILDSLDDPATFDGYPQYCYSKLLVNMFVAKLATLIPAASVIINTSNPGATKGTSFLSGLDSFVLKLIFNTIFSILGRKPQDAARNYVHSSLVLGPESHGSFTDWKIRCWPVVMYGDKGRELGDQLWVETLKELGLTGDVVKL